MQPSPDLSAQVDRWVATGIISPDQAERIRADLATHTSAAHRPVSLVAEGLGYLGGVIVVVGLGLVLGISWQNITPAGKIAIAGAVWLILTLAGALIPARRLGATGARLRGVLWTGASVAIAAGLGLIGDQQRWDPDLLMLVASGGAVAMSASAWAVSRHVLQQLSTVASLSFAGWSGATMITNPTDPTWPGLAVWGVGVVWFVLSLLDVVPRRSGGVFGSIGATIGGLFMISEDWGYAFALGTVIALVAVAVIRRELGVLGVGSVGTLIALPIAVDHYFPGVLPAALALVVGGLALVTIAVFTARRRRTTAPV
jgi:hypothetical protein